MIKKKKKKIITSKYINKLKFKIEISKWNKENQNFL